MSTQAVNFEGHSYQFPADAKDDEILSFLHTQHLGGSPTGVASPILPPNPNFHVPDPGMHEANLISAPGRDPGKDPDTTANQDIGKDLVSAVKGAGTGLARVSGPNIMYQVLRKAAPKLNMPAGVGMPGPGEVLAQGALMGEGANEIPHDDLTLPSPDAVDSVSTRSGSAGPPSGVGMAKPRSLTQDIKGTMGLSLRNPLSWKEGVTSIKSILQRVTGGDKTGAEVNPPDEMPPGTSTMQPKVTQAPLAQSTQGYLAKQPVVASGAPASGTAAMLPLPERPAPVARPIPAWQSADTTGQPVDSLLKRDEGKGNWGDRPQPKVQPKRLPSAPGSREDALDDQGVKQDIENLLQRSRNHTKRMGGSIATEGAPDETGGQINGKVTPHTLLRR